MSRGCALWKWAAVLASALAAGGCRSDHRPPPRTSPPARTDLVLPPAPAAGEAGAEGGEGVDAPAPVLPAGPGDRRISLVAEDEEIWKVVQRIAALAEASVVCDPEHVRGRVTVNLVEVPWRRALESVAHDGGYVVAVDGSGVLQVVTLKRSYNLKEPVERR